MAHKEDMNGRGAADALGYTKRIINAVHDPLLVLHEDLKVALANRSFYHAFEVIAKETEGRFIYELGDGQWNIPKLRYLLETILPKNESFNNFEVDHYFQGIGRKVMSLNACRFVMEANRTKLIVITFKDITDHNMLIKLYKKVMELEDRFKEFVEKSI